MRIGNNSQGIWQLLSAGQIHLFARQGVPVRAQEYAGGFGLPGITKIRMAWRDGDNEGQQPEKESCLCQTNEAVCL